MTTLTPSAKWQGNPSDPAYQPKPADLVTYDEEIAAQIEALEVSQGTRLSTNTFADMIALTTPDVGDFIQTRGRSTPGDNGHSTYKVVAAGTGTADGTILVDLTGSGLQAELQFDGHVRAEQFDVVLDASGNPQERSAQWQAAAYYAADLSRTNRQDSENSVRFSCGADFLTKEVLYLTKTPADPTKPWNGGVCEVEVEHDGKITATTGGGLETHLNAEATRLGVTLGTSAANAALKSGLERPLPILNIRNKRSRAHFGELHCEFLCSGVRLDSCSESQPTFAHIFSVRKYCVFTVNASQGDLDVGQSNLKQWRLSDESDYDGRMMPGGALETENNTADAIVVAYKDHKYTGLTFGWCRAVVVLLDQTRNITDIASVASSLDLAGIGSPATGDERITLDTDNLWRYDGSAWIDKGNFYSEAELGKRTYPDALARAATSRHWDGTAQAYVRGVDYVMTSQGCGDVRVSRLHPMQGMGSNAPQPRMDNMENGGPILIECWNQTNNANFIDCDLDAGSIQIHGDAIMFDGGSHISGGRNKMPVWNGSSFDAGSGDRVIVIDPRVRVYAKEGNQSSNANQFGLEGIPGVTIGFYPGEDSVMDGDYSAINAANRQDSGPYKGPVSLSGIMTATAAQRDALQTISPQPVRLGLPSPGPSSLGNHWLVGEDDDTFNIRPLTVNFDTKTGNFTAGLVVTGGTSGGGTSGATGTIQRIVDNGTDGTLYLTNVLGTFIPGEPITDTSTGAAAVDGDPVVNNLIRGDIVYIIDVTGITNEWNDANWYASSDKDGNGYKDLAARDPGKGTSVDQPREIVFPRNRDILARKYSVPGGSIGLGFDVANASLKFSFDGTDFSWSGAGGYKFDEVLTVSASGSGNIITANIGGLDKMSLFNAAASDTAGLKPYDAAGAQVLASRLSYHRANDDWFVGGTWDQHSVLARELDFETRAEAVTWLGAGNSRRNGVTFAAAGLMYEFDIASTDISDMTGTKPFGRSSQMHFGAVGDGVTDDSTAISEWVAYGGDMISSPGTFLAGAFAFSDCDVLIEVGSSFLMTPDASGTAFINVSDNVQMRGLLSLDGNRVARKASGLGTLTGLRILGVTNVDVGNVLVRQVWGKPFILSQNVGSDVSVGSVRCAAAAGAFSSVENVGLKCGNITVEAPENDTSGEPARGIQINSNRSCGYGNLRVAGLAGTTIGTGTRQQAVLAARNDNCSFGSLFISGIDNTLISSHGISMVSNVGCDFGAFTILSATVAVEDLGNEGCKFAGAYIDHEYNDSAATAASLGSMRGWDCKPSQDTTESTTERNKSGARHNYIPSLTVVRGGVGLDIAVGATLFGTVLCEGCALDGISFDDSYSPPLTSVLDTFPGSTSKFDTIFGANIQSAVVRGNGRAGIAARALTAAHIGVLQSHDNGQDTTAAASSRAGIAYIGSGSVGAMTFGQINTKTVMDWTSTSTLSIADGVLDADNRLVASMIVAQRIAIGAHVNVVGADGGADVIAKVYGRKGDELTLEFPSGTAATLTIGTSALTGTWDVAADGLSATPATGSPPDTEILGRTYIKNGADYALCTKVVSSGGIISSLEFSEDDPFLGASTGVTLSRRRLSWAGVSSRQISGLSFPSSGDISNLFIGSYDGDMSEFGVNMDVHRDNFAAGSMAYFDATLPVNLTTNTNFVNLPSGFSILGHRGIITSDILGTTGALARVKVWADTYTLIDSLTLTKNTKWSSGKEFGLNAADSVRLEFYGGSDNVPSGGAARIEVFGRTGFDDFVNV